MDKYGKVIREIREKKGDTREELASKLGISDSALGKYERGERKVKTELIEQVAELYGIPLSTFFGEEGMLPEELREVGAEWITFAKKMKEKNLTPEQIEATLEFLDKIGLTKKT